MLSWHQRQGIRRNGAPDYAHDTKWTVVSGRDMMSCMHKDTKEEAEGYLANVKRLHRHTGYILPPKS